MPDTANRGPTPEYIELTKEQQEIVEERILEKARVSTRDTAAFEFLIHSEGFRDAVVKEYVQTRKPGARTVNGTSNLPSPKKSKKRKEVPAQNISRDHPRSAKFPVSGTSGDPCCMAAKWEATKDEEICVREQIIDKYAVKVEQFENSFKDSSRNNLKLAAPEQRKELYKTRVGCLGMKTFDVHSVPLDRLVENMYLYIMDDIEAKEHATTKPGPIF